jgi:Flp pilus assembly protein TadG
MRRRFLRSRRGTSEGQALVEFALVLPMFALFVFVVIQLGIVFLAYYSETRMARETARWLAVNSSSSDDAVATHVQSTMLPGLANGTISSNLGDTTNAKYEVGTKMTVTFTSCGTTPSAPPCTNVNRAPGATLYVEMSYDVHNLLFLPSTFRLGNLQVAIPTGLPAYRVHVMVE